LLKIFGVPFCGFIEFKELYETGNVFVYAKRNLRKKCFSSVILRLRWCGVIILFGKRGMPGCLMKKAPKPLP
jgi:hypothetical protein